MVSADYTKLLNNFMTRASVEAEWRLEAALQLNATNGATLAWHFAEYAAYRHALQLFRGISGIDLYFTPALP